jgi:hypothetical protein
MFKPNLYRPPPPPPRAKAPSVDPLVVLSVSPTVLAHPAEPPTHPRPIAPEELTDLADDDLELWAQGGTRIIPKPTSEPPVAALPTNPYPSYYPVAFSTAPKAPRKSSNVAIWVALAGVAVLAFGMMAAVAGFYIYRAHEEQEALATATTTTAQTETQAPIATATETTATATPKVPEPLVTATATVVTKPSPLTATRVPTATGTGALRTFSIATGRPVYVDGHEVGLGGSRITTACGRHFVVVGGGKGKTVDIPCTGAPITVGTPDGT